MYAITNKVGDPSQMAIVGQYGRLDFPAADGPLLASMLDSEFPRCLTDGCPDRDVCPGCHFCDTCGCDCDAEDDELADYEDDDVQHPWDDWDEEDERRG